MTPAAAAPAKMTHAGHTDFFPAYQPLLPDYVALHAKWRAAKTAVICGDSSLTWAEFRSNICRIANGLRSLGILPGDRVGIVMDNGLPMAEVIWGAMTAGAVAVPLNTSLRPPSHEAMLRDAGVRAVFVSTPYVKAIDGMLEKLPTLLPAARIAISGRPGWQDYETWCNEQSSAAPSQRIDPNGACNIIYSSGTTGTPKGIVHTHLRRRDWALDLAIALRYHSNAVTLLSIGMYSNIVWVAMLATVVTGGTLVIMPKFDAREALALIDRHGVTNTAMVPLQYQQMLETPDIDTFTLDSVTAMMSAGSPLWERLKRDLMARFGPTVIELYGLTEGVITTLAPEDALRKLTSVGKPIQGTDLRLIRADGAPCAPGEIGEIVGAGRHMMQGYHGRDDASADMVWVDEAGRTWLRTGDLGRLDDEGFLYISGRIKDMILSGGQNIYPVDLEAALLTHPDVSDVAVIGVPHEKWGETPLALVVLRPDGTGTAESILTWANARLGRQQRISAIEIRDHLPRNSNGKLLKAVLRHPYWQPG